MNTHRTLTQSGKFRSWMAAGLFLLPAIASAHPGHFHPDETDEFDAVRSNFLHLHGSLEIILASLALAAAFVFVVNRNRPLRIAAAATICASLAFLTAH